jgi:acyl-CoA thioesterase-1
MIALFQRSHAVVILAGRAQNGKENVYRSLAEKYRLPWIPDFLAGVAGDPTLTIGDHIHPNADGYAIVVNTVMKTLEPLLKK